MVQRCWWLLAFALGACFSPKFDDAKLTCGTNQLCPPGFVCGDDGLCHTMGARKDGGGDTTVPAAPMLTAVSPTSPANNNGPVVTGTAEAGTTVTIYGDSGCTMQVATGTAAALASPGITVTVADDSTSMLAATATDEAGNTSPCSTPLTFVEDSTPPAAPAVVDTMPSSPSRSIVPTVRGTAEAATTITLYASTTCSGSAIGTGNVNSAGEFSVTATVPAATVTSIAAIATDAAGNASACSNAVNYEQDASSVAAPVLSATTPTSPSSSVTTPMVSGTAEAGTTVRLFTDPTCSGTAVAMGVVASDGKYSISVTVSPNTVTTYYAMAVDTSVNLTSPCTASGITYQHDSQVPPAPVVMASTPASPSNSSLPAISGTAEPLATVRLFTDSACATTAVAMGTASENGTFSINVSTTMDATFYATTTDAAGNTSVCSTAGLAYDYDATPPNAPTGITTLPTSPSKTNNMPIVQGTAEANSMVRIYLSNDCSGEPVAQASSGTTTFTISVTVPTNAATPITATATDAAGNASACSATVTYVHDDVAPAAPTFTASTPSSPANSTSAMIMGTAEMDTTVQLYTDGACTTTIGGSAVATSGTFTITIPVTDNTTTTVYGIATDSVGNASACSTQSFTFIEDSTAPTTPVLNGLAPSSTNTTPTLTGSAESGAAVRLYASNDCSGTATAMTTASGGSFSAMVTVSANSQTPFTAQATDPAGNVSACSGAITYIHDNMTPGAPTDLASNPVSPAPSTAPAITGMAEAGSTVRLFTTVGCGSAVAGTATAESDGTFSVPVTVGSGTTTTFYATATDAAGNASTCSTSFVTYTEDSEAPAPPDDLASTPASPSSDATPEVTGTAEAGSVVKLFTDDTCTTDSGLSGTAAGGGTFSITATVGANTTTTFWATATDVGGNASACSTSSLTYVHDGTTPDAPVLTATVPGSPANANNPTVDGTAEVGATVKLYTSSSCTTGLLGTGVADDGTFSIVISVNDNTTTNIYASATDEANNVSGCSTVLTYMEDSSPPSTPTDLNTDPGSPANENSPSVTGTSDEGATISIYTSSTCSTGLAGTATAGLGGAFSVPVSVSDNTTTLFYARASDAAGNQSSCSSSVAYEEDSDPPSTPIITSTTPTSPGNDATPVVSGTADVDAGTTVKIFTASNCTGQVGSGLATAGTFSITTSALTANMTTTLYALAEDSAGNPSPCSLGVAYTHDGMPPGLPANLATNPVSPANANTPTITGTAEALATVLAFDDSNCTSQVGSTTADGSGAFGITVTVVDNTTTTFYLRARDAATNLSACSATASITYQEDSTAVATPVITSTSPTSPNSSSTSPTIIGTVDTSLGNLTVSIFANDSTCSGTAVATGTATSDSFSIGVTGATTNGTTIYYASATNGANDSGCSAGFSYTHDSTAPSAPTGLATTPTSPANNNQPTVTGSAEAGSTVTLYTNDTCSTPSGGIGTGTATGASFSIQVENGAINDNTNTTIYATATDAAGNESPCSTGVTYVEDSAAPSAPTVSSTTPTSPSNASTTPTINGSAEANATVKLYTTTDCSGAAAATGTAGTGGAFNIQVSVSQNSTTTFKAKATDAAGNTSACSATSVTYVHDNVAPAKPSNLAISPVGPANDNAPEISGDADTGSLVTIHTTSTCTVGSQVAGPLTASAGTFGTTLSVADNTTTTFYAQAVDAAGNSSGCSLTGVQYREDSQAPNPPAFGGSTPGSPSKTSTTPSINGSAEIGATVSLFTNSACTGTATATGPSVNVGGGGAFGISVSVTANSSTTFYATATDAAGNESSCTTTGFTYVHDNVAPGTPSVTGTNPPSPANNNNPQLTGTAEAGATILVYGAAACTTSIASGTVNGFANFSVAIAVSNNSTSTFYARAVDAAGNQSACTTTGVTYIEDSLPPGVPSLTSVSPGSPNSDNTPTISGSTGESGATIKLYGNSLCSGTVLASGTSVSGGSFSVTPTLATDGAYTFYATATDAAGNASACSTTSITYIYDATAPAAPTALGTVPASPANDTNPDIVGTAESGATVKVYTASNCSGTPVASGLAASDEFAIAVTVTNNSTSSFYLSATDAAGNVSACSARVEYVEDSVANAPILSTTNPTSPSSSATTPTINGTGERFASIALYTNGFCSGTPAKTGTISIAGSFALTVTVTANTSTTFYGKITDQAGNVSSCSAGLTYVHDNTPPSFSGGATVTATATSDTEILVQWSQATDNLTSAGNMKYEICVATPNPTGSCTVVATVTGVLSHTLTSGTASTRYGIKVRAVDQVNYASVYLGPASDRTFGPGPTVTVDAGYGHACTLLSDGTVRCWGQNNDGQLGDGTLTQKTTPVDVGLSDVVSISAGGWSSGKHTCAVKSNGTVWCWGDNNFGQLGTGGNTDSNEPVQVTGISNATSVSAGGITTCVVRATGGVSCWGYNFYGQLGNGTSGQGTNSNTPVSVTGIGTAVEVAVGQYHACARLSDGNVKCWGFRGNGKLGDGGATTGNATTPVTVSFTTGTSARALSVGIYHSCVVTDSGQAHCWGGNASGQLGNGTTNDSNTPVAVRFNSQFGALPIANVKAISAGGYFDNTLTPTTRGTTCLATADGNARCVGENSDGQVGIGTTTSTSYVTVATGSGNATAVTVGSDFSCYRKAEGTLYCFGSGDNGRLGNASTTGSTTQDQVENLVAQERAVQIDAHFGTACARMSSGRITCWGLASSNQAGDNITSTHAYPYTSVLIGSSPMTDAIDMAFGYYHGCAVRGNGTVVCWGANDYGQLGLGNTTPQATATTVSGVSAAVGIAAGNNHTCALLATGSAKCWGYGGTGALGYGEFTASPYAVTSPVTVMNLSEATEISANAYTTCAREATGGVKCWGRGTYGNLGNGGTSNQHTPVAVSSLTNARSIDVGENHACSVIGGGSAQCWGRGDFGQMGNSAMAPNQNNTTPLTVTGSQWTSISTGTFHNCGLKGGAIPYCWGRNQSGQLGLGSTDTNVHSVPASVSLQTIFDLGGGVESTCALHSDGTAECWGMQQYGRLGNGSTSTTALPTPTDVLYFP